jgi:hypothetical protein
VLAIELERLARAFHSCNGGFVGSLDGASFKVSSSDGADYFDEFLRDGTGALLNKVGAP